MKTLSLLTATTLSLATILPAFAAENYKLDPNHTNILWHANHFGYSNPSGRFGITEGTLKLDEKTPAASSLNVTVDITGLATGIEKFNEHIKSPDFLDAAKFPTATFKSTKVETTGTDTAKITGDFTLHGVTKPLTLDVKLNKIGVNPMFKVKTAGFTASTILKRSEYGLSMGIPNVSDDIRIDIESEANLVTPTAVAK